MITTSKIINIVITLDRWIFDLSEKGVGGTDYPKVQVGPLELSGGGFNNVSSF